MAYPYFEVFRGRNWPEFIIVKLSRSKWLGFSNITVMTLAKHVLRFLLVNLQAIFEDMYRMGLK